MTSALAGLGRLVSKDERDQRFLLPQRPEAELVRARYWNVNAVLDQGDTSECVGYSGWSFLRCGPTINKPPFTPTQLYHWAQEVDEWEGTDYQGSSVRGCFKALHSRGFVSEYRWATTAEAVVAHLLTTGPVILGTSWHLSMFMAHAETGYIHPEGEVVGGHAYCLIGASRVKVDPETGDVGAVRIVNSWGPLWAQKGRAWMSFKSLEQLIQDDGEACTATEIRIPTTLGVGNV